jgi:uncharacterized protein (TIGR02145 family)
MKMRKKNFIFTFVFTGIIMVLISCKKENQVPTLSTSAVSEIKPFKAICGGVIISNGGSDIINQGVCWSTNPLPTTNDSKTTYDLGVGKFSSGITQLNANTKYFVRAYASNNTGTGYGQVISFSTIEIPLTITDIDGNVYQTVSIGKQIWLKENLKTTKYNDGTLIPNVRDSAIFGADTSGAYCYYNNTINNSNIYGNLYNGFAVNTKKLCPVGWHVPTDNEWGDLILYLDSSASWSIYSNVASNIAGGKLKEVGSQHWLSNENATNESGFTALPSGSISKYFGYTSIRIGTDWWSTTDFEMDIQRNLGAWIWGVNCSSEVNRMKLYLNSGLPVRCIMD